MKTYIGCGLTHVPRDSVFEEHTGFIHELASTLTQEKHLDTYALVNSDPQLANKPFSEQAKLCYAWDRNMVEEADLLITEANFPSTGLGIEMQIAESRGIPIVLCFRDFGMNRIAPVSYENPDHSHHDLQIGDGYVTLMALGVPTIFRVVKYADRADGIAKIRQVIALVSPT